jgi:hypothetical protein
VPETGENAATTDTRVTDTRRKGLIRGKGLMRERMMAVTYNWLTRVGMKGGSPNSAKALAAQGAPTPSLLHK